VFVLQRRALRKKSGNSVPFSARKIVKMMSFGVIRPHIYNIATAKDDTASM
jgi:hypothetical protein